MEDVEFLAFVQRNRQLHEEKTEAYHSHCAALGYDICYTCGKKLVKTNG